MPPLDLSFVTSAPDLDGLPPSPAEVAVIGRSNVGKSSLLNAVAGRRQLAHTSKTPGRTRLLNCYALPSGATVVDLPGYGYAKVSKSKIQIWTDTLFAYLRGRTSLQRVNLLIDSRHGLKDSDREAMDLFDRAALSYQIVLTKADEPKAAELAAIVKQTSAELAKHPAAHPEIRVTSSRDGRGIAELRTELARFAA